MTVGFARVSIFRLLSIGGGEVLNLYTIFKCKNNSSNLLFLLCNVGFTCVEGILIFLQYVFQIIEVINNEESIMSKILMKNM